MPNWVLNEITIEPLDKEVSAEDIITKIVDEEGDLDFDKIIPVPDELNVPSSSDDAIALASYLSEDGEKELTENDIDLIKRIVCDSWFAAEKLKEFNQDPKSWGMRELSLVTPYLDGWNYLDQGEALYNNYTEYGVTNAYQFRVKNWGSKWNAEACSRTEDGFEFLTAWEAPLPVYYKLANIYNCKVTCEFANEDIASRHGYYTVSPAGSNFEPSSEQRATEFWQQYDIRCL
jgi:hypothetical protein